MNIVIILACLLADRYYDFGGLVRKYDWFNQYLSRVGQRFSFLSNWPQALSLAAVLLPLLCLVALFQLLFNNFLWGLPGFVFNLSVLFYALGSTDLRDQYSHYFEAKERGDLAAAYASISTREPYLADNAEEMAQGMAKQIFRLSNEQIVAVIFWFLVFGATGAIAYRLILQLCQKLADNPYFELAAKLKLLLDWIPVRLLSLAYAVAGNFVGSFSSWLNYVLTPPKDNETLLINSGLAAISLSDKAATTEDLQAVELVDRALIVILVVLSLMTLTSWLS